MVRITVILCFTLTLLCPVVCLADASGECCAPAQADDNCEAMTFGALAEQSKSAAILLDQLLPSFSGLATLAPITVSVDGPVGSPSWREPPLRLPSVATRRQAWLQSFLF